MTPEKIEQLLDSFKNDDEQVRWTLALNVDCTHDADLIEPLIAALQNPDYRVRHGAVIVLSKLGDNHAFESLLTTLDDDTAIVRSTVAEGLAQFTDEDKIVQIFTAVLDAKLYEELVFILDEWLDSGYIENLLKPDLINPLVQLMKNLETLDEFNNSEFDSPLQVIGEMKKAGLINEGVACWIVKELGSKRCEVHDVELQIGEGEVIYGLRRFMPNDKISYPHANSWRPGGCFKGEERQFTTLYCQKCREIEATN